MQLVYQTFTLVLLQLLLIFVENYRTLFVSPSQDHLISQRNSKEVCLTPGCVEAAAQILHNMDPGVDPCDNFYRFACGGWMDSRTNPKDRPEVNVFFDLIDDLDTKMRVLLQKPLTGDEPYFIKAAKLMYDTCVDVETIEKLGDEPLRKVLSVVGGWPVLEGEKWDSSKFDWIDTLFQFRNMGFNKNVLMDFSLTQNREDNTYIIQLDEPLLPLYEREYYIVGLEDSVTSAYLKTMVTAATKLGADETTAAEELLKAFEFEAELAINTLPEEDKAEAGTLYNKYTVQQLQEIAPQVDWPRLLSGIFSEEIKQDEPLIVTVPGYFKNFSRIIADADKRAVANYMVWRMVITGLRLVSKDLKAALDDYTTAIFGSVQETPRREECFSTVSGDFELAMASYFVQRHFKKESKDAVLEIVKYIQGDFLKALETVDWMDSEIRQHAIEKAKRMSMWIGYPDELLDDKLLSERYPQLSLTENSYFDNHLKMQKMATDYSFGRLRKKTTSEDWKEHVDITTVTGTFYSSSKNSFEYTAGILQSPFFSIKQPNYLNFGRVGFIVGHEITHGFDDEGKEFDKDGEHNNWWNSGTEEKFWKKAQCFTEQYNNYNVPEVGMKINGERTQKENVADNGGIKRAYRAYKAWVEDHGEEQTLPALNYTNSQLFWIGAANVWCGKYTYDALVSAIQTSVHPPLEYRIIGTFSNSLEFANDFQCSPGSPMNPENKCQAW